MTKTTFKNEFEIQDLIAADPTIIPASACRSPEPRRWLLVQREARIPNPADPASPWAVDFLLIDQDAMPTLVEVKLATPGKTARRQCLGQMLDYLTGARAAWDADALAVAHTTTTADARRALAQHTSMAPRDFWRRAEENVQASRVRIIYVAAQVSTEILSAIELLNSQLRTIEAHAVHISRDLSGRATGDIARPVKTLPTAAPKKPLPVKAKSKRDRYQVLDKALLEEHLARPSWTDSDPLMGELARFALDLGYTIKRELKWGNPENRLQVHPRPHLPQLFSIFPGFNDRLGGGSFDFGSNKLRKLGLSHLLSDPRVRTQTDAFTGGGTPASMCSRLFETLKHLLAFAELLNLTAMAAGLPQASDAGGSLEQPSVEVPHPPEGPVHPPLREGNVLR